MDSDEGREGSDAPERTLIGEPPPHYECSFCGKSREEVEHLIAGPNGVYICNECVALCNTLLTEEDPAETE